MRAPMPASAHVLALAHLGRLDEARALGEPDLAADEALGFVVGGGAAPAQPRRRRADGRRHPAAAAEHLLRALAISSDEVGHPGAGDPAAAPGRRRRAGRARTARRGAAADRAARREHRRPITSRGRRPWPARCHGAAAGGRRRACRPRSSCSSRRWPTIGGCRCRSSRPGPGCCSAGAAPLRPPQRRPPRARGRPGRVRRGWARRSRPSRRAPSWPASAAGRGQTASSTAVEQRIAALVGRRADQPRGRRRAVHQRAYGREPPGPDLPQARGALAHRTRPAVAPGDPHLRAAGQGCVVPPTRPAGALALASWHDLAATARLGASTAFLVERYVRPRRPPTWRRRSPASRGSAPTRRAGPACSTCTRRTCRPRTPASACSGRVGRRRPRGQRRPASPWTGSPPPCGSTRQFPIPVTPRLSHRRHARTVRVNSSASSGMAR